MAVLLACGAGCGVLSAALVWSLWPNTVLDMEKHTLAHQTLKAQLASQQRNLGEASSQLAKNTGPAQALAMAEKGWPTSAQVQSVVLATYRQAQSQGLQWESFKPEPASTAQTYAVQPLTLRLRGNFAQILAWRNDLFKQSALWVPDKWILAAQSDGQLSLEAVLHLYVRAADVKTAEAAPKTPELQALNGREPGPAGPSMRRDPFSRPALPSQETTMLGPSGSDSHPLRRWPLKAMAMVGSFSRNGVPYALVQTPMGLFSVATGERLGAEGGRVQDMDETRMQVAVRLPQAQGSWVKGLTVLSIQQAAQP